MLFESNPNWINCPQLDNYQNVSNTNVGLVYIFSNVKKKKKKKSELKRKKEKKREGERLGCGLL